MAKVLISEKHIDQIAQSIATKLNSLYMDKSEEVVLAPILQGAVPFFQKIAQYLEFDPYVDFIGMSSYRDRNQGEIHMYKMFDPEMVKGRIVWLFDDLADSGNTLKFLKGMLLQYGAADVKVCVLLKKQHCTFPIDLEGIEVGNEWVWGFGMDAPNGRGRTLNAVYVEET
jgi:hypoxanthine phosphoribosyltransferase